jgi:hypothetical protein
MARLVGRRPSWRWAVVPAIALAVTGCTSTASPATHPPQTSGPGGHPASEGTAQERFTVLLSPQARQLASSTGVNLSRLVASTLDRINALLPGAATTITVTTGSPSLLLIPQTGENGYTDPGTGQVSLAFGQAPRTSLTRTLNVWLPRDAATRSTTASGSSAGQDSGPHCSSRSSPKASQQHSTRSPFPGRQTPGPRPSRQSRNACYGKRQSPSSATTVSTIYGCSVALAYHTGAHSLSATTSSTTTGTTIPM